jgi:CTP synthase (UTP-ammonia lyase)
MARAFCVALVGDFDASVTAHQAIPEALRLAACSCAAAVEGVWVHTASISDPAAQLAGFDGIWCVPASPYANTAGALGAIRYAREQRIPFFGTCGGFQHAVLEYARNVHGMRDAAHAEIDPAATAPVISPLACSLVEKSEAILLSEGGLLRKAYGQPRIREGYHCRYGLNPEYAQLLLGDALHASAHDGSGEVRAVELASHPFFVATLFQPERRALRGEAPPPVVAFVASLMSRL